MFAQRPADLFGVPGSRAGRDRQRHVVTERTLGGDAALRIRQPHPRTEDRTSAQSKDGQTVSGVLRLFQAAMDLKVPHDVFAA